MKVIPSIARESYEGNVRMIERGVDYDAKADTLNW